jgi:ribonuclease R
VLYRIHEQPDPLKVEQFTEATSRHGLQLPTFDFRPGFAGVVEKAKDSPAQYVINNLMLRTMQQARYSPENTGHFGLAAEFYLHFTCPSAATGPGRAPGAGTAAQPLPGQRQAAGVLAANISMSDALHLSKRERVSVDVERNTQARLSALFLQERIGEEFAAIISGVASFGMFVERWTPLSAGAVPLADLIDDYYILDTRAHGSSGTHPPDLPDGRPAPGAAGARTC